MADAASGVIDTRPEPPSPSERRSDVRVVDGREDGRLEAARECGALERTRSVLEVRQAREVDRDGQKTLHPHATRQFHDLFERDRVTERYEQLREDRFVRDVLHLIDVDESHIAAPASRSPDLDQQARQRGVRFRLGALLAFRKGDRPHWPPRISRSRAPP
jgi:hypothetical protein